jgi:hypothetical protein
MLRDSWLFGAFISMTITKEDLLKFSRLCHHYKLVKAMLEKILGDEG